MNITAILHVRNEALYIRRCIEHLIEQGVQVAIIDNESTDETVEVCRSFSPGEVVRIETVPFTGVLDLRRLLEAVHRLRRRLAADWIVYQGADEILMSHQPGETLRQAIERVDRLGFDAINFDEFVFVPEADDSRYEGTDYRQTMRSYYFFEPAKTRLVRCFKNSLEEDNIESGGHFFPPESIELYGSNFVLRHYICLSMEHARSKYGARAFPQEALERGWHHNRVDIPPSRFQAAAGHRFNRLAPNSMEPLRTDSPEKLHFWEWVGDSAFTG